MRRLIPLLAVCIAVPGATAAQDAPDPPNAPALARSTDSTVALRYQGRDLFTAGIARPGGAVAFSLLVDSTDGRVSQVLKWTAGRGQLTLTGIVETSEEGFAAEVEPREDGLRVVRHAVGAVLNRLNRAVYDRHDDWVLSVDEPAAVTIVPLDSLPGVRRFRLVATGAEVTLRFRPRYFQRHRGLAQYRPWTYRPWSGSVAGWTSWYAFKDRVTAEDIRRTAGIMARRLLPFGYRYLQIDDGYQRSPIGLPEHWLVPNDKFPGGLAGLRESIGARGLEPGIWTNVSFQDSAAAAAHPGWFVPGPDGRPARGRWVGYVMDGSAAGTLDTLVLPVYRALRAMGWSYFTSLLTSLGSARSVPVGRLNSSLVLFRQRIPVSYPHLEQSSPLHSVLTIPTIRLPPDRWIAVGYPSGDPGGVGSLKN